MRTAPGAEILTGIYGERDLLVAECVRQGIWDTLDAASFAALVAALVYQPRRNRDGEVAEVPTGPFGVAFDGTIDIWARIDDAERRRDLQRQPEPCPLVSLAVLRWAHGARLESVLAEGELTAGDFVRLMKTELDLLDQIEHAVEGDLRRTAAQAADLLHHGIIAYSATAGRAA